MRSAFREISVKVALQVMFVFVTVSSGLLIGYVVFSNGHLAVNDVAASLRREMTLRIVEHVREYLALPVRMAVANARAMSRGVLDAEDAAILQRHFAEQLEIVPDVSGLYFGNTQGGISGSKRSPGDDRLSSLSSDAFRAGMFRRFAIREDGSIGRELATMPGFDTRTRLWYRVAKDGTGVVWSPPYIMFAENELVLSASCPVRGKDGQLAGVMAVDVLLSQLSGFLHELEVRANGQAMIIERSGQIVASSRAGALFERRRNGAAVRFDVRRQGDEAVRQAVVTLADRFGDLDGIRDMQDVEYTLRGRQYFAQVAPLHDASGLDWLVLVIVPEASIMSTVLHHDLLSLTMVAVCLGLALLLGWVTSRMILRPISALDRAVGCLAEGRQAELLPESSRYREIASLNRSFNAMSVRLSASMVALRHQLRERNLAETALRQSEGRYRTLLDLAVDGILLGSSEGVITGANECMCAMLGMSRSELVGRHIMDLPFAENCLQTRPLRFDLVRQGDIVTCERTLARCDGATLIVEMRTKMMPDGTYQASLRDVTVRRQDERELRRQTALFRNLFDRSPEAIAILDEEDRVLDINQAFTDIFDYELSGILGQKINDVVAHQPFCADAYEISNLVYREQRIVERETLRCTRDGAPVEVMAMGYPIFVEGRMIGAFGIYRDISARRRSERELRESTERFELAMMAARDGLFDWNIATGEVYVSPVWKYMLGYSEQELDDIPHQWMHLTHPDDVERIRQGLELLILGTNDRYEAELRLQHRDGHWVDILSRGIVQRDETGRALRLVGTHLDLSERKRFEADLVRARDEAEAANRAKSEFLANMSHEIRTPLNGIMGMLQILNGSPLNEEQTQCVDRAMTSTMRLTRLLTDILDLSRIESGRMTIRNAWFEVQDLVDSVSELFAVSAREKSLVLACRLDSSVPVRLIGDEARVRQILFNLVGNSLKYTHAGRVCLEIVPVFPLGDETVSLAFTVTDTGIGIPQGRMDEIFEPFRQIEGAYTRRYQGAGLGLAIVRRLVDLMNGQLHMTSTIGQGTHVRVVLPFARTGDAPEGDTCTLGAAELPPPMRILVAEDDALNRLAISTLLTRDGHEVILVEDGTDVLDQLAGGHFDCVLMDVQMPVMSGVEATRRIRSMASLGAMRDVPIIALTAYAMTGDRERFLDAGMTDYLAKPVGLPMLRAVLVRICGVAGCDPGADAGI